MYRNVTIEFLRSSSPSFPLAVEQANKHPSFEQIDKLYRVTYKKDEWQEMINLVDYLSGWRNRWVYVDGKKIIWRNFFRFLHCFKCRLEALDSSRYCFLGLSPEYDFNIWGCVGPRMPFRAGFEEWLCYGHFDDDTFIFDKKKIKNKLTEKIYPYRFCPVFKNDFIPLVIDAFPEKVNPNIDKNWRYQENYLLNEIKAKKIKIKTRYGYRESFATGVAPASSKAALSIFKNIKKMIEVKT